MIIKDDDIQCIDIECWNLDENYEEYMEGINDTIIINYYTWDCKKIKIVEVMKNMNLQDALLLQRILSEYGYVNVTVSVTENNYDYDVFYIWELLK